MSPAPLAVTGATLDGERVVLRADDGLIAEVGEDVGARDGDEIVDGAGMAIVPGLVNAHTHAAMTLFRGYGDDLPLMEWLEKKIWPVEAKLDAEDVYWGARLACAEMIRGGTVRFWDMYWQPAATARAVAESGLRANVAAPLIDTGGMGADSLRDDAIESLDALEGIERVDRALAPHAIYTVSEDSLRWIAETAGERDLPIHIHLSETEDEVANCVREHGERPAAYLDRTGALGPRTLLAHSVWLDDAELDLIAERGATVVSNPVANLKLAVGRVFDYPAVRRRGIPVGIGTDGAGSNNSLDLFEDIRYLSLLCKHETRDPAALPAPEAWEVVTGRAAPLVGASGRIEAGEPADFILVRTDSDELAFGDLTANLVYAATSSVVDTTVVAGRVLMRGGVVEGAGEIRERALERAKRLGLKTN
jgi:5-methylthioadenosine/S-adenosylhomocysteine deaminase